MYPANHLHLVFHLTMGRVARDSPYGRTGSYRGHGAGALKPAQHLNSNKKQAQAQEAPAKTEKKQKKPQLAW